MVTMKVVEGTSYLQALSLLSSMINYLYNVQKYPTQCIIILQIIQLITWANDQCCKYVIMSQELNSW